MEKVYVVFFSRADDPDYEIIKVYGNEIDAIEEVEKMRKSKQYYAAYMLTKVVH